MRKRITSFILLLSMLVSLTGCSGYDEVTALRNIEALNSESNVTYNYNLSYADEQEMIYAQVIDRQLLDLSTLDKCSDSEVQQVVNYMNQVDDQLIGNIRTMLYQDALSKYFLEDMFDDDAVIDTCFTDYLLAFFERTPYYWQREKTTIRGIDAESRSIVVDVKYTTIDFEKNVKPDSTIVRGEPNYQKMLEVRHNKWLNILQMKINNPKDANLPIMYNEFVEYYGDPNYIFAEQRSLTPTASIFESGNQTTYTGLVDTEGERSGASLTVRYVLVPNYVLGINLGIKCKHMYITEYKLDKDCTEGLTTFTKEGYATVTDSVYNLIYSYFTCIDESDYSGLYKLTHNFKELDKFYYDMFTTTYRKHEGFSISLFDITGTHITCGVTISSKERAKGAEITFPSYTDKYYVELELIDGVLKVENMILLSRKLEGEPAINVYDADVLGFSAKIELDNDDRVSIENLICNFSALQLLKDTTSDDFSYNVDVSMSSSQLTALKTNMTSLSGVRKVVWLQNYQQGTSNYASVKCKELYQDETNAIVEAEAIYDFILKGGRWYIYNYTVNSSVKLDTTNLNTTGSLCLCSPGSIDAYTSQIKGSISTNLDNVSDTSVAFDHEHYIPVLKDGHVEQGLVKHTVDEIDEAKFNELANGTMMEFPVDYVDYIADLDTIKALATTLDDPTYATFADEYNTQIYDMFVVYYNIRDSRYNSVEQLEAITKEIDDATNMLNTINVLTDGLPYDNTDALSVAEKVIECLMTQLNAYGGTN